MSEQDLKAAKWVLLLKAFWLGIYIFIKDITKTVMWLVSVAVCIVLILCMAGLTYQLVTGTMVHMSLDLIPLIKP